VKCNDPHCAICRDRIEELCPGDCQASDDDCRQCQRERREEHDRRLRKTTDGERRL